MKINVMSDLHLEFEKDSTPVLELPGGDVLVLAGDILMAQAMSFNSYQQGKYHRFAEHNFHKYEKVFMIAGNHEYYHFEFFETLPLIEKEFISKYDNVKLLNNEVENYKGVNFFGGTLWTNMDNENPVAIMDAKFGMNDFNCITYGYIDNGVYSRGSSGKFLPEDSVYEHKAAVAALNKALEEHKDEPFVVITHHAPSEMSIPECFSGSSLNPAYASNLDNLMYDNDNILLWVHGHTHSSLNYLVGMTQVVCNPRGYVGGFGTNPNFNPNLIIEINEVQ